MLPSVCRLDTLINLGYSFRANHCIALDLTFLIHIELGEGCPVLGHMFVIPALEKWEADV